MRKIISLFILFILTSCGGGGGGGGPITLPPNSAPIFTSSSTANIIENITTILQATASDADGNNLTFAISSGGDSTLFSMSTSGLLSFIVAPNFEAPRDANADNIYTLTITVTDGRVTTNQAVVVTVVNSREGIAVRLLPTRFNAPVAAVAIASGSLNVLVAEKAGGVWLFDPVAGTKTLIDTIAVGLAADQGMLSIAADPSYSSNGRFFISFINGNGDIEIREYIPNALLPPAQDRTLLVRFIPHALNSNDRAAALTFGIDGALYAAIGDAGGTNDPTGSAQDSTTALGKLLRITRNPDPFAGASPQPYIFQTVGSGLHNPASLWSFGSDIFIGDRGQARFGEIDQWRVGGPSRNFGWPFREGTSGNVGTPPAGLTAPLLQTAFGTGGKLGNAINGGVVYTGTIASLANQLTFGDADGAIWAVPFASLSDGATVEASGFERRNEDFAPNSGVIDGIVAFVGGAVGRVLLIDRDGDVFSVEQSG